MTGISVHSLSSFRGSEYHGKVGFKGNIREGLKDGYDSVVQTRGQGRLAQTIEMPWLRMENGQAQTVGLLPLTPRWPCCCHCPWLSTDGKPHLLCFSVSSILCNSRTRHSNWDFSSPRTLLHASHWRSFSSSSSFRASKSMTCSSSIVQVVFSASIVCKSVPLSCALYQTRISWMLLMSD